jgi:predicted PhzF superfamily epimerase YddE/YHI9
MSTADAPLYLVDAFAVGPFTGNPAAVCVLEEPAEPAWMQRVGGELNQAATAFVAPGKEIGTHSLWWFTPTSALTLCGHGTLAAAHVLWERGEAPDPVVFDTPGGRLTAQREGDRVGMRFPALAPRHAETPDHLSEALGGMAPRWVGRNDLDLFVELEREADVRAVRPDLAAVARIEARAVVVTAASDDPAFDFASRVFCPRIGIPEDQATGSVHCGLGPFWAERLDREVVVGAQRSPRGGVIEARMDRPGEVCLVGRAVTVARGELIRS